MKKLKLYAKHASLVAHTNFSARVAIKLRQFGENGVYDSEASEDKENHTIWIQGMDLAEAFEVVKSALLNSRYLKDRIIVE